MKKYIIAIVFLLVAVPTHAYYYIVNEDNVVTVKTKYLPNQADLDSRNEITVQSEEDISLTLAEYRNGKIVEHKDTQAEKVEKQKKKDKKDEMTLIRNKSLYTACIALEGDGVVFREINCENFN